MAYLHCPNCGNSLETRIFEQRPRAFCVRCQIIHYDKLNVGAGALIEKEGKLLLLQRTIDPFNGCWNLPAGYAEIDESPPQTARREVREETGLEVEIGALENVYHFNDDPRGNGLLILYHCQVVGGKLGDSSEGIEPTYFSVDHLPADLAGGGHDKAIFAWRARQSSR